ncbi:MAG: hypothetical protein MPJ50_00285 [Pirellulales bacterium]|nr:hypothetical protein [Pirellulales bacterium]
MSEVPYDPSGQVQSTGQAGYAQNMARPGSPGSKRPDDGAPSIIKVGVLGVLYGLLHMGVCTFFLFGGMIVSALASAQATVSQQGPDGQATVSGQAAEDIATIASGVLLVIGILGMLYGAGCITGSIGVFMRKGWGRIVILIYAGLSGIEGLLGLVSLGRNVYAIVKATEVVELSVIIELVWIPMLVTLLVTLLFLAFCISSYKVLLAYGSNFD